MEAYIRNVPDQATEAQLKKFFDPVLKALSITVYTCQKGKKSATLTFLVKDDCLRFLAKHGQITDPTGRRINGPGTKTLKYLNVELYCSPCNRPLDPHHIRSMEMSEKRKAKNYREPSTGSAPNYSEYTNGAERRFQCSSLACGTWSYSSSGDLVFTSHLSWQPAGTAKFQDKRMTLEIGNGQRVDMFYSSVADIVVASEPSPSMTFTLWHAPQFSEHNPLAQALAQMSLGPGGKKSKSTSCRISSLGGKHEQLVAGCLVYRLEFAPAGFDYKMSFLKATPGFPHVSFRRTTIAMPREPWALHYDRLKTALGGIHRSLPFPIMFQLQRLAQDAVLSPTQVLGLFPAVAHMVNNQGVLTSVLAIQKFSREIPFPGPEVEAQEFSKKNLVRMLAGCEQKAAKETPLLAKRDAAENLVLIHRAMVTPCGIYLTGPEAESKNRVLRKYPGCHDFFLRVTFAEEDGQAIRYNANVSQENIYYARFKKVLQDGISIGGRIYRFLGFSHSSLRAQTCWFMATFVYNAQVCYDDLVINDLGNFSSIRSPAKCAARIGQAFSETPNVAVLKNTLVKTIADVERNGRVFTDGVGSCSEETLRDIQEVLTSKSWAKPTCFQIRRAGQKGMIALDSRLSGRLLCIRPSMDKFPSNATDLELCGAAYKPLPMYLNPQTIKIMEDLGVEDNFFLDLQSAAVDKLRSATMSAFNAAKFLTSSHAGDTALIPWLIKKLSYLHVPFQLDGFLRNVVEMAVLLELRALKHKARILVENGVTLYGITDETGTLGEGEVLCLMDNERGVRKVVTGDELIITRAPALHPGDVRMVKGIEVPRNHALMQLSNCIIFSQKGSRDLPSMLSGGDLDGDLYNIIWDSRARLKHVAEAADYPRVDPIDIGRTVNKFDIMDFFIQFMATDQLGRIAMTHRVLADQKPLGTLDPDCITLAEMHSTAVDFSKTGIPVDLSQMPKYSHFRPDFTAPGPHVLVKKDAIDFANAPAFGETKDDDDAFSYNYYESTKILGRLYRAIDEKELFRGVQKYSQASSYADEDRGSAMQTCWAYVQHRAQAYQWHHLLPEARDIKDMYEECLLSIMSDYSLHHKHPLSEIEVVVGNILGKTGAQSKQQRELSVSMKEAYDRDVIFTIDRIIKDDEGGGVGGEQKHSPDALERSIACFAAGFEESGLKRRGSKLCSFLYVAAAVCLRELEG